jgi:hypothetical protein
MGGGAQMNKLLWDLVVRVRGMCLFAVCLCSSPLHHWHSTYPPTALALP